MKVAVISKADAHGGGASHVAETLTECLKNKGHSVVHWAAWSGEGFGGTRQPLYGNSLIQQKWVKAAHEVSRKAGLAEIIPYELPRLLLAGARSFDLLHFHDLSSAISPWTLWWLSRYVPVVWTIHDCSPFTGGCLYPMDCTNYQDNCGACPQLGKWPLDTRIDFTGLMQTVRSRIHKSERVACFSPSQWMANMAESSGRVLSRPMVVANGVDTDVYSPAIDRAALRSRLNLPQDRLILMASANSLRDERKGIRYALSATRALAARKPLLLLVGWMNPNDEDLLEGIDWHATGYVSDSSVMAEYYAVSDLFLFFSLADNQPLAVLESMACGTPVIAFDTGGIPELIRHNENGFLILQKENAAIAHALESAISSGAIQKCRESAREFVLKHHSLEVFTTNHLNAYETVIEQWHKRNVSK